MEDALAGDSRRSAKRDKGLRLATPWGQVYMWFYGVHIGDWDPAHRQRFEGVARQRAVRLWECVEGMVHAGTGAKRVPALLRYFVPESAEQIRPFVIERVHQFLLRRGLATGHEALAQQQLEHVERYVEQVGVPADAVWLSAKGLRVDVAKLCAPAGVSFATIKRCGDSQALIAKALRLAEREHRSEGKFRYVSTSFKAKGRHSTPGLVFNFYELGVERDGLLDQMLDGFEVLARHQNVGVFRRVVTYSVAARKTEETAISGATIRSILSTPIEALSDLQVRQFLDRAEFEATRVSTSGRTVQGYMEIIRAQLGRPLSKSGRSLPRTRRGRGPRIPGPGRGLISDLPDPGADELLRPAIAHAVGAEPKEALVQAQAHLAGRLDRVERACNTEIERFIAWRTYLESSISAPPSPERLRFANSLYASGTPDSADIRQWLAAGPLSDILAAACDAADAQRLNTFAGESLRRRERKHILIGAAAERTAAHFPEITVWWRSPRHGYPQTRLILSRWFVPRAVQLAIGIKIQIASGWNRDTVRALKASGIRVEGASVELQSVKSKTGEPQHKFIEAADRTLREGLRLMQAQEATLQAWPRETACIFCSVSHLKKKGLHVSQQDTNDLLPAFQKRYNLPAFTLEQIRNQKAADVYLRRDDPYEAQALLGHADLATTSGYIRHRIITVLNAANVAAFRRQLAATIVLSTSNAPVESKGSVDQRDFVARLLYPLGFAATSEQMPADCDAWLADPTKPLVIDAHRVEHLVRQRAYYAKNWQRLRAARPEEFNAVHLPRMEFTAALWAVLLDSPYAALLEQSL